MPQHRTKHKSEHDCVRSTSRSISKLGGASVPASRSSRSAPVPKRLVRSLAPPKAAAGRSDTAALRREFRAWRASLPTQLERDTMLVPEWIAETVVQEAERFLVADLPAAFTARLAAKAHYLYPRHKHFQKLLKRPGNMGRNHLYMYMRHWTAAWLKRERPAHYKKLPYSFANGQRLPVTAPGGPQNYPDAKKLVTADCIRPVEVNP